MLYEMVAGHSPFVAATWNEIISGILSKQAAPPLARYSPLVPEGLDEIVEKALAKKGKNGIKQAKTDLRRLQQTLQLKAASEHSASPDRGSTADEQAVAETTPAITQPASSAEYIVHQVKSHKRVVIAATTVLLLIFVSVFLYVWRFR